MGADPEPSVVDGPHPSRGNEGDGEHRRTDPTPAPTTERDAPPSSVRPSAPTLQGESDPGVSPGRPVAIRTPLPPTPIDHAVPQLSTTTPTGLATRPDAPPISTTLRSGGSRTLVGSVLGRYEIAEEVGHGGMATVYRARDPRLERDVALKVIHRHLRDNPEIAHRFAHEARAVAKLKHPSIVEIYDVPDLDDEERFLVAEYVDGPSLRRYLQDLQKELGHERPGLLPPEIAAAMVLQVLSALARAHEEGIVHRDIKPENILVAGLRGDGARDSVRSSRQSDPSRTPVVAKLTDFGIAKILDAQSMTSTGQILGSPAHMAPEQIESGDITPRVDVFATGVLFYELLTGSLPFDGKNPAQVIRRVLEGEFAPADRVAPTVGGRWSGIVAAMLARDPDRRPADANAVAQLIRDELSAMGVTDPDRELVEFIKSPRAIAEGWGARVKPILFDRAMAARERGDVVGSAHDLNRALAYDPTDPKLVRAVTTMRSRERRLRGLRRAIPIALAAVVVAGGTFGVVRWTRMNAAPQPSVSAVASTPSGGGSNESVSDFGSAPNPIDSAPSSKPTPIVTAPIMTVPIATADAASNKRRVRFSMFPAGKYSIDGGPSHDSFSEPVQELSVGEHTVTITGNANCCEILTKPFRVLPGEGEQTLDQFRLTFRPARLNVIGAEGAKLTVRRDGETIAAGPAPLDVKVGERTDVVVTIEVTGFPAKTVNVTLVPGDARFVQFDK